MLLLAACAGDPVPAPAPEPLPPLVIAACPAVPDDVVAALGLARPASPLEIADRAARGGPRCPWSEGTSGYGSALVYTGDVPSLVVVRRWPDAPAEILLTRPVPLDAERRIAASTSWGPSLLTVTWWDAIEAPCSEEIGPWDGVAEIRWTCPDRAAPPVAEAIAWPDPVDR